MADLARDSRKVPVQVLQPSTTHVVTVDATSNASSAITLTNIVRIVSTVDCHIAFGGAGGGDSATTNDMFVPASVPEYFEIGDTDGSTLTVVYVTRNASDGTLYITEMI